MRWALRVLVLSIALVVLAPAAAGPGRLLLGPETHLPWTVGLRLEWQPFELLEPSVSIGYAPAGMVAHLEGGDPAGGALALALRLTTQPFPIIGMSFNAAVRAFAGGGGGFAAVELGVGWRIKLWLDWMIELGVIAGPGAAGPYVGLGGFFSFD